VGGRGGSRVLLPLTAPMVADLLNDNRVAFVFLASPDSSREVSAQYRSRRGWESPRVRICVYMCIPVCTHVSMWVSVCLGLSAVGAWQAFEAAADPYKLQSAFFLASDAATHAALGSPAALPALVALRDSVRRPRIPQRVREIARELDRRTGTKAQTHAHAHIHRHTDTHIHI
jgi:hypothetical protein